MLYLQCFVFHLFSKKSEQSQAADVQLRLLFFGECPGFSKSGIALFQEPLG